MSGIKEKEGKSNSTSDYIREMENAVDDLCERLSKDSKEFDSNYSLIYCINILTKMIDYYILM